MKKNIPSLGNQPLDEFIDDQKSWLDAELRRSADEIREPATEVTFPRDIDIVLGEGWLDHTTTFSVDYTSGQAKTTKDIYPVMNWGNIMRMSFIDVQRGMRRGKMDQELLVKGILLNWNKALELHYVPWLERLSWLVQSSWDSAD